MKVHNCIFTFNKAKDGGAIYFIGLSTVEKSTFKNNKANQKGGAIYNQAKSLKISDSIFKNNIAGKTYNTIFTKVTMTQENVTITPKDGTKVKK
jgi:predicted outer membrane repeat protein